MNRDFRTLLGPLALLGLPALTACSATGDRAVPDMAPAKVVYLTYVTAEEAAQALGDGFARPVGAGVVVTAEPRDNALIIAAAAGRAEEVELALAFLRRIDVPRMAGVPAR
jgi:hypothetical protein